MRRITLSLLCIALLGAGQARAEELYLAKYPRQDTAGWGFVYVGASLVFLGMASNAFSEEDQELLLARQSYAQYKLAGTAALAQSTHYEADRHYNRAKAAETTGNVSLWVGVGFGLGALYSFIWGGEPQKLILVSDRGVTLHWDF
jgi:hypothetical protein